MKKLCAHNLISFNANFVGPVLLSAKRRRSQQIKTFLKTLRIMGKPIKIVQTPPPLT